jgi:hypothetical protein
MIRQQKLLVLLAGIAFFAACEDSIGPTDTPTPLELAAKPSASTLYTYMFTGDIHGTVSNVAASPSDPFKQVSAGGLSFSFPDFSVGDTMVCDQEQPDLAPSVNAWGGYASAPWGGDLNLSRRKKSSFHLQLTGTQTDGAGSINLAVNDVPVVDTNDGVTATIEFQDSRALISAFSFADTVAGGEPIHDSDDRCVNFTITAMKEE